jgi:hypothetical protein
MGRRQPISALDCDVEQKADASFSVSALPCSILAAGKSGKLAALGNFANRLRLRGDAGTSLASSLTFWVYVHINLPPHSIFIGAAIVFIVGCGVPTAILAARLEIVTPRLARARGRLDVRLIA